MSAFRILIAEDDEDDRMLIEAAWLKASSSCEIDFVENGEDLMRYLRNQEGYKDKYLPHIILLDLNMPRKDGHEALVEIKSDERLHQIPVVVLSTSSDVSDVKRCYQNGSNAYITKPKNFQDMVHVMKELDSFWLKTVMLP